MDQIELFQGAIDQDGTVVSMPFGSKAGWVIADPQCIDHILKSPRYGKGEAWKPMRRLLFPASGALSANDDPVSWRAFRIPVNRSLAPATIRSLIEPMASIVDDEISKWPIGTPFELSSACAKIIQKLIVWVFFGSGISGEESDRVGNALVSVLRLIAVEQHGGSEQDAVDETAVLQKVLQGLIRNSDRGIVTAFTELDPVIGSEILLNLFLAGYETPSLALSWTLSLISQCASTESQLLVEMECAGAEVSPNLDSMHHWPQLSAALDESMRLYTPLWAFPREALASDILPSGHEVAAGSILMLSILHMHRLPSIWGEDAADFRPGRFLDRTTSPAALDKKVFLPFGAGMRICPAEMLTRVEILICLNRILRRFSVRLLEQPEWEPAFTLRPKDGIHVVLTSRDDPIKVASDCVR